jgi:hypothetical protein
VTSCWVILLVLWNLVSRFVFPGVWSVLITSFKIDPSPQDVTVDGRRCTDTLSQRVCPTKPLGDVLDGQSRWTSCRALVLLFVVCDYLREYNIPFLGGGNEVWFTYPIWVVYQLIQLDWGTTDFVHQGSEILSIPGSDVTLFSFSFTPLNYVRGQCFQQLSRCAMVPLWTP